MGQGDSRTISKWDFVDVKTIVHEHLKNAFGNFHILKIPNKGLFFPLSYFSGFE
jgi:hypothetical protein